MTCNELVIFKGSNYIEWRSPKTEEFAPIGRVLVSNNIEGCGEYKVYLRSSNQYLLACTKDGKNWKYHMLDIITESVTLVPSNILKRIKAPY